MKNEGQISVLGCGWLGLELSKILIKKGFKVKGSTTSKHKLELLENSGIRPYQIQLTATEVLGDLSGFLRDSALLIINIPPGLRRSPEKNHVQEIAQLLPSLQKHKVQRVIFVSSTSVFEDAYDFPEITNETIPNATAASARQLIAIETLLQSQTAFTCQIIRPGGLFGGDRHPGKFLAGRTQLKNGEAPVNLVHRKDLINCILKLVMKPQMLIPVNAVYPHHPSKSNYYSQYCQTHQLNLPKFDTSAASKGKRVYCKNTEEVLQIRFAYPP